MGVKVRDFCEALCRQIGGDQYALACEHEHSCCVLIAHTKFRINGRWHTWIDYDRFNHVRGMETLSSQKLASSPSFFMPTASWQLALSGDRFGPLDYAAETPAWAAYDDARKGFDPVEQRFHRSGRKPRPTRRRSDGSAVVDKDEL